MFLRAINDGFVWNSESLALSRKVHPACICTPISVNTCLGPVDLVCQKQLIVDFLADARLRRAVVVPVGIHGIFFNPFHLDNYTSQANTVNVIHFHQWS